MRISDWSSDVCSSDLSRSQSGQGVAGGIQRRHPTGRRQADDAGTRQGLQPVRDGNDGIAGADMGRQLNARRSAAAALALVGGFCASSPAFAGDDAGRSEEPTSELPALMRISYAVFCLKKKKNN